MLTRRVLIAGAIAGAARAAGAVTVERSLYPAPRPAELWRRAIPTPEELIDGAALGGRVGYAVADARSGELLEARSGLYGMPPASVAKTITCAYGLARLGPGFRFRTRLLAGGPVTAGRLDGDLWLVGGGDPMLVTDDLDAMAAGLAEAGITEVTGRLRVAVGALPAIPEIDPEQPDHVGYNPAVGALNLNFNRVHFEWERTGDTYAIRMDARSETLRPAVTRQRMQVEDRRGPVYTYELRDGIERWTVARAALGDAGSRWLPVRQPALYTAEVLQLLARERGIVLRDPEIGGEPPAGAPVLAEHVSAPLEEILGGMMQWSVNITAEAVGLMATRRAGAPGDSLADSATEMNAWAHRRLGTRRLSFVDHSGLGEDSRVRPVDMVRALVATGSEGQVRSLMKPVIMRDVAGNPVYDHPVSVVGKTGTLNFVSGLSGFATAPSGRDLAFAVFCADLPRRQALSEDEMERPDGGRSYNGRAKALQQALIERWAALYA
ncbi:D-alanyl-D-alanine carboxypeptidase/D-alanyl-D-alanine-endopeptidase [Rhodobacterales bacterium HKCCE2091]|nr:D-alanyl-D-alanine carboxypeptidase/D-alanyl-D-alanine-endopeptidase [Rhodobacterales bacterium HKCCE2091]